MDMLNLGACTWISEFRGDGFVMARESGVIRNTPRPWLSGSIDRRYYGRGRAVWKLVSSFWTTACLQLQQDVVPFHVYLLQDPPFGFSCLCEMFLGDRIGLCCVIVSYFMLHGYSGRSGSKYPVLVALHCCHSFSSLFRRSPSVRH